jgi:hypothetical protein
MTRPRTAEARVLAIDPTHRGFGYVVFEGPDLLVDWGERNIRGQKNAGSVEAVTRLIERYQPDVLVVEDPSSADCRRWPRVQLLIRELGVQAARTNITIRRLSRAGVRKVFGASGASTKYEIARAIASRFPELALRLPPERKPWMSEDARMAIFDASAFALAFLSGANHASAARKRSPIVQ